MLSPVNDNVSTHGHLAFLRQVAHDDELRAELEADPQAALARFGLQVAPDQLPSRVTLPGKKRIQESLACLDVESDGDDGTFKWHGLIGS